MMGFTKVTRKQAKLRMAIMGVSGGGKTLGALYIAYGITGDWDKVALIDTEHERGRLYANRSDLGTGIFLYQSMVPPYSPDKYKAMVADGASAVGPDGVVIVDSLSHAWNNEGGVLDIKESIAAKAGKNSYTAWNEAGKEQNSLVNTILAVQCHTIVTLRSKMDYVMQLNDKGKQEPIKLGLAPVQRDDTEYEFDIVLDVARTHIATASKDTTFLDKFGSIITPELGKQLAEWLNQGVEPEKCSTCKGSITAAMGKTAEEMIEGSTKTTGVKMCAACLVKWLAARKKRQPEIEAMKAAAKMTDEQFQQCVSDGVGYGAISGADPYAMSDKEYAALAAMLKDRTAQ